MNKINKIILWIIAIIVIAGLIWLGYSDKEVVEEGEVIKIGAVLSLTGYASDYGQFSQQAINLAVKEINENGGINNRIVKVIFEDDQTSSKDSVSAYQKLVNVDEVEGIIGGLWDFVAQPIMPLSLQNDITFISPINFRIEESFEPNSNTFLMMPEFKKVIQPLEIFIENQNINKLGVVRFNSPWGSEISRILFDIMKERGQNEIIDYKYNEIGGNDFRTEILKLKDKEVEGVFLDMAGSDMNNFLQRLKENNFQVKLISYPVALDLLNNPEIDKNLIEGISFVNWEAQPEEFSKRFFEEYGILPQKSADRSYDGLYVLANAIANTQNKSEVNEYIENNKFETINGEIIFTSEHLIENLPIELMTIKNGESIPYEIQ